MPMAQAIQWQAMHLIHLGNKLLYGNSQIARLEQLEIDRIANS
jgi:hypothetical protein